MLELDRSLSKHIVYVIASTFNHNRYGVVVVVFVDFYSIHYLVLLCSQWLIELLAIATNRLGSFPLAKYEKKKIIKKNENNVTRTIVDRTVSYNLCDMATLLSTRSINFIRLFTRQQQFVQLNIHQFAYLHRNSATLIWKSWCFTIEFDMLYFHVDKYTVFFMFRLKCYAKGDGVEWRSKEWKHFVLQNTYCTNIEWIMDSKLLKYTNIHPVMSAWGSDEKVVFVCVCVDSIATLNETLDKASN